MRFLLNIVFYVGMTLHSQAGYAETDLPADVAFSPSPAAMKLVVNTIGHAHRSIEVAAYSFTSIEIANALIEANERGVIVRVVLDKSQTAHHYRAAAILRAAGIPIRVNWHYAIMHDKYIIIDDETVETGSFNFTASAANRNAENVIVIKDNKMLAEKYVENWKKLWEEATIK